MQNHILIKGAKHHNLKNITVKIPRNKLTVITGMSGSGKSSLAFDTLYAEGQRRYMESLSSYARQFLEQMEKPEVEQISGLSPAIAIEQKTRHSSPRSIVATTTEIYDYLRLMYAHIGQFHCPNCKAKLNKQSSQTICKKVKELVKNKKVMILAPIVIGKKGEHQSTFVHLRSLGLARVRIDEEIYSLDSLPEIDKNKVHTIEAVIDRLKGDIEETRYNDSIERALKLGNGIIHILIEKEKNKWQLTQMSEHFACLKCQISFGELKPRNFSFNSPYGACKECSGLGKKMIFNEELLIPDFSSPVINAFPIWKRGPKRLVFYYNCLLSSACEHLGISENIPFKKLTKKQKEVILYGTGTKKIPQRYKHAGRWHNVEKPFEGVIGNLERRLRETESDNLKKRLKTHMTSQTCNSCNGGRLNKTSLSVTVRNTSINQFIDLSITEAQSFIKNIKLNKTEEVIAKEIVKEIKERLYFLDKVGLNYLSLNRESGTLSGGEAQRIRLATQLGAGLVGVLYILDEPSIGLHQKDNDLLIATLCSLRDLGNTVIVVEHDLETIEKADYLIDLGPKAGREGGNLIYAGSPKKINTTPDSLTGQYITKKKDIHIPKRTKSNGKFLSIKGANKNNLKNVSVKIPLGQLTCITGVSGSGKSTLINELFKKIIANKFSKRAQTVLNYKKFEGIEHIDKMIVIDQSPIGKTPHSNPATYTNAFTTIREIFSLTNSAKSRGYKPGRFSFNVKGGRCEICRGHGFKKIEMNFLPDVYVECEICQGTRYNKETLKIQYKGKNITNILDMTINQALDFFSAIPKLKKTLQTLQDVGLGYMRLGQPSTTLSGGEAQRIKLASELQKTAKGHTLYILDEPTTGLHIADIEHLLQVLYRLRNKGNSVWVIEHNLDVVKVADYIIDLGPGGGDKGGEIIAQGTPEEVIKEKKSYTGQYLKKIINKG